jgi:hypothetical protein
LRGRLKKIPPALEGDQASDEKKHRAGDQVKGTLPLPVETKCPGLSYLIGMAEYPGFGNAQNVPQVSFSRVAIGDDGVKKASKRSA